MPEEEKLHLTPEEEEHWAQLETNEKKAEEVHQSGTPKGKEVQKDSPRAENNNDHLPLPEQVNPSNRKQEISACFEAAIKKLDKVDSDANKKRSEIVQELARDLEGKMPTDEIAAEIVHQLRGRIGERRVYECLGRVFRRNYSHIDHKYMDSIK
jgi:signal recognition particle GTPase